MQNKIKYTSEGAADIFMVPAKLLTKHANGWCVIKDLILQQFMQLWIFKLRSHVPGLTSACWHVDKDTHILTASHVFHASKKTSTNQKQNWKNTAR